MAEVHTTLAGTPLRAFGKRDALTLEFDPESLDGGFTVYHQDRYGRRDPKPVGWFAPLPAGGWHIDVTIRGYEVIGEDTYPVDLISDVIHEVEARYESEMRE